MGIFVNTAGSTAYLRRVTNLNYNAAYTVCMVAGVLMLAHGGFSYTKENTAVKVGPI